MIPVVFGIEGKELTKDEVEFFLEFQPAGFIIFKRNIESKEQLKELCFTLKSLASLRTNEVERRTQQNSSSHLKIKPDLMILIDQEGGRVQRFTEPHTQKYPAPSYFASLVSSHGIDSALKECYNSNFKMAQELKEVGINVNCTPVADLSFEDASNVIGDRGFGQNTKIVIEFCKQVIKAHLDAAVRPIIKHIPGHGRAKQDSHFELPYINTSLNELASTDFIIFQQLSQYSDFAMTAHIVYEAIDPKYPATFSSKVINHVKNEIGFKGDIITDCITMEALSGNFADRAINSLNAGCNYVLHCSGNMPQMQEIAKAVKSHQANYKKDII